MEKTFLLGVGAQKGGTTWVYQYLRNHPDCNMGSIKEYAVFNSVFRPDAFSKRPQARMRQLGNMAQRRLQAAQQGQDAGDPSEMIDLMDVLTLQLDLDRYVPHFDRLYNARPDVRLVGDITPEYSALNAEQFTRIRDMLQAGGYRVKVIFLMRDPAERCYSAIRMGDRNTGRTGDRPGRLAHERFADEAVSPWCDIRTRYEKTIPALEAVFPSEDIFYGFYESFLAPGPVREMTDFLGISPLDPNLSHKANASPREHEPDAASFARVRDHYKATYAFCRDRFGAEVIDAIWG